MTLSPLLRKLSEATGPDRELDALVWCAVYHPESVPFYDGAMLRFSADGKPPFDFVHDDKIKSYTSSVDVVLYLVTAKLPGAWIDITGPRKFLIIPTPVPNYWRAIIEASGGPDETIGWGATPALALCIALLKALEAARPLEAREG